jgi:hypothetical protein
LDAAVSNTGFSQGFTVYLSFTGVDRPLVRVKDVELLDSNSQPTGITIPYGDIIDSRILGTLSNRAEGNLVESYTGELAATTPIASTLFDLYDANFDFREEEVENGHRINILSGYSVGTYEVVALGGDPGIGLNDNYVRVAAVADGGTSFVVAEADVHYSIGLPSAGLARLYFLEPTSVEIQTGLAGGRIRYEEEGTPKEFRFSEVDGYDLIPAGGSDEDTPRDMRLIRSTDEGGGDFNTIVELTDSTRPGVFELEIQAGDAVEINEQLTFRTGRDLSATYTWNGTTTITTADTSEVSEGMYIALKSDAQLFRIVSIVPSTSVTIENPESLTIPSGATTSEIVATLEEVGIFGAPAGLRTIAGQNLVSVPANSLIDFTAMNRVYPLVGQTLFIDSGSDVGEYIIESIETSKSLRLSAVMVSTTETIDGYDANASRTDITFTVPGDTYLEDTGDGSALGSAANIGHYITLFESTRGDYDGTYEIKSYPVADTVELDFVMDSPAVQPDLFSVGNVSWVRTELDTAVEQAFRIYKTVAKEFDVVEVAPKRANVIAVRRSNLTAADTLTDPDGGGFSFITSGVVEGDILEILTGVAAGQYFIDTVAATTLTIRNNPSNLFPITGSDIPYRVWGGLHGSRRMLKLGPKDSADGKLEDGEMFPYVIKRPSIARVSSTVMQDQFDGSLYYMDVQIESLGAGDDLNLAEDTRMVVTSGLTADGYTYSVENTVLTFSTFEEVSLNFDRRFLPVGNSDSPDNLTEVSGRNLQVTYEGSTTTRLVNDLMRSDQDRPTNANPIARHFLPSFVYTSLSYRDGVSAEESGQSLEDYINSLGAESILEVSDLEAILTRRGATFVQHPIEIVTVTHDIDRNLVVDRSDNMLGGTEGVPYNGTGRISAFFTILGETLLVERV